MSPSGNWQDLTIQDFEGIDPEATVALLPVAAVEGHGPHQICLFGIAVGPGPNAGIGCADVVVAAPVLGPDGEPEHPT